MNYSNISKECYFSLFLVDRILNLDHDLGADRTFLGFLSYFFLLEKKIMKIKEIINTVFFLKQLFCHMTHIFYFLDDEIPIIDEDTPEPDGKPLRFYQITHLFYDILYDSLCNIQITQRNVTFFFF